MGVRFSLAALLRSHSGASKCAHSADYDIVKDVLYVDKCGYMWVKDVHLSSIEP